MLDIERFIQKIGLSGKEAAQRLDSSPSQMSRMRSGSLPTPIGVLSKAVHVMKLNPLYGIPDLGVTLFYEREDNANRYFEYLSPYFQGFEGAFFSTAYSLKPELIFHLDFARDIETMGGEVSWIAPQKFQEGLRGPDGENLSESEVVPGFVKPLHETVLQEYVKRFLAIGRWTERNLNNVLQLLPAGLDVEGRFIERIQSLCSSLSFKYIDDKHLFALGVNQSQVDIFLSAKTAELNVVFAELCDYIKSHNLKFKSNFYIILDTDPLLWEEQAEKPVDEWSLEYTNLLSYGEKLILKELEKNRAMMTEILVKLN